MTTKYTAMLEITNLERVFLFDNEGQELMLSDPHSTMSKEAVLNYYAQTYPILTTARIEGPEINDDAVEYRFTATIGTKG